MLDGFEIALRLYDRQFDRAAGKLEEARRAHLTFRRDAQDVLEALRTHKLGRTLAFFGIPDVSEGERFAALRALVPLPVEHVEGSDAGVSP